MEYDPEGQCFLLDDGRSVGAMFELSDIASEAKPEEYLTQLQKGLQGVFQDVFPAYFDNESPMLSMMEFWLCLGMSAAELEEVERFKTLTDEERMLFRSVRKEAKKYVEGVLLCNKIKTIFRNIPPALALALAMTEKHEKAECKQLMLEYGCNEVEAAMRVAVKLQTNIN